MLELLKLKNDAFHTTISPDSMGPHFQEARESIVHGHAGTVEKLVRDRKLNAEELSSLLPLAEFQTFTHKRLTQGTKRWQARQVLSLLQRAYREAQPGYQKYDQAEVCRQIVLSDDLERLKAFLASGKQLSNLEWKDLHVLARSQAKLATTSYVEKRRKTMAALLRLKMTRLGLRV